MKNVFIGLLSIGVIVLSYFTYSFRSESNDWKCKHEKLCEESKLHYGYDLIDDIPMEYRGDSCLPKPLPIDGNILDLDVSKHCANNFKECKFKPDVLAYHVGEKTLREMLDRIDLYNKDLGDEDTSCIIGYRFYQAVTTRSFPIREGSDTTFTIEDKKDLVAVPVRRTGKDYSIGFPQMLLSNRNERDTILRVYSHFRPCPRVCGPPSLSEKENENLFLSYD